MAYYYPTLPLYANNLRLLDSYLDLCVGDVGGRRSLKYFFVHRLEQQLPGKDYSILAFNAVIKDRLTRLIADRRNMQSELTRKHHALIDAAEVERVVKSEASRVQMRELHSTRMRELEQEQHSASDLAQKKAELEDAHAKRIEELEHHIFIEKISSETALVVQFMQAETISEFDKFEQLVDSLSFELP